MAHGRDCVDLRTTIDLTDSERALLRSVLDRDVHDVAELGRALGFSDDGVLQALAELGSKLVAFARAEAR